MSILFIAHFVHIYLLWMEAAFELPPAACNNMIFTATYIRNQDGCDQYRPTDGVGKKRYKKGWNIGETAVSIFLEQRIRRFVTVELKSAIVIMNC